jgi:transcription antitermination factor NusG
MSAPPKIRYYAYMATRGFEQDAAEQIRGQGFEVLAIRELHRITRRRAIIVQPRELFAGYGFVQFDMCEGSWRNINNRRNGIRVVTTGGENPYPIPIEPGAIDRLVAKIGKDGYFHDSDDDPAEPWKALEGKAVRIFNAESAFDGHIGLCEMSEAGRLKVLMNLFQRPTKTDLDWRQVKEIQLSTDAKNLLRTMSAFNGWFDFYGGVALGGQTAAATDELLATTMIERWFERPDFVRLTDVGRGALPGVISELDAAEKLMEMAK